LDESAPKVLSKATDSFNVIHMIFRLPLAGSNINSTGFGYLVI
jgi:hypothetical protein